MMSKRRFERVMFVSKLNLRILLSRYTPGSGLGDPGLGYIWTMLVLLRGEMFLVLIDAYIFKMSRW